MSNIKETILTKESAQKAKEKWDKYFMNTYAQTSVVIDKGYGATIIDVDGKEYIDFTSGYGASSLGYNHKELVKALQEQVVKITHTSNLFFSQVMIDAGEKLIKASKMSKVFFINSGSEATELAMKIARKYSSQKYGENRGTILSLKDSFHGRTMMALMATGVDKYHKCFYPLPEGFKYTERNNISDFKSVIEDESICAVLMEPIQGEGGVNMLDTSFVREVVKICNEKDILVIFDEVQCGIGRTGKLFGFNNFDVTPDIITIAKGLGGGLPIGGFLCNQKLSNVLTPGDHGTTYGGNPIACAGALVVLDEICTTEMLNEITTKGDLLKFLLENLKLPIVKEIRGKGLMIGIETTIDAALIQKKALEKGLLVLTAGKNVVRLLPPLLIDNPTMLAGIKILEDVLTSLSTEL